MAYIVLESRLLEKETRISPMKRLMHLGRLSESQ